MKISSTWLHGKLHYLGPAGRGALAAGVALGLAVGCSKSSHNAASSKPPSTASAQHNAAVGGGPSASSSVLTTVTSQVPGLSHGQAATGVGSLLGLAQAKMPASQFQQVEKAVPGASVLMGQARKAGLPGKSGLTNLSSLDGVFRTAGISHRQVEEMIPVLGNTVSQSAGPEVGQAFLSALK